MILEKIIVSIICYEKLFFPLSCIVIRPIKKSFIYVPCYVIPRIRPRKYLRDSEIDSTMSGTSRRCRRGLRKGAERSEVWRSNVARGVTNQLLVVQLRPHTQHQYYRDHYLSSATPLPRQRRQRERERETMRGELSRMMHAYKFACWLWPVEIERDSTFCVSHVYT